MDVHSKEKFYAKILNLRISLLDLCENLPNDIIHVTHHRDHPGASNVGWTRPNVSMKDLQETPAGVSWACRKLRETNADAS